MQLNQEFNLQIKGLTHDGQGVGRLKGRVVFVPQAVPGDLVRISLRRSKGQIVWGELKKILVPSDQRVQPLCPHSDLCGGCQLQHFDYQAQLYWKEQMVKDALIRIGKLKIEILPIRGMDHPWAYRNKAQFHFRSLAGRTTLGFFRKGTHSLVGLKHCPISHPFIIRLALGLQKSAEKLLIRPYSGETGRGVLKKAVIRISFSEEKLMLILLSANLKIPRLGVLIEELTSRFPQLVSVAHRQAGRGKTRLVWGESHLVDSIGQLSYLISPDSFFQVNPIQAKVLYDAVSERVGKTGQEMIVDLYCGAGTIGLYLAAGAKRLLGVETVLAAVQDARENAVLNKVDNADFVRGRAEDCFPRLLPTLGKVDYVILNPPRKGCPPALLQNIEWGKVRNIIYVSCHPATLARDLKFLSARGYQVGPVQPVDMFPWTSHVECVVLMSKK